MNTEAEDELSCNNVLRNLTLRISRSSSRDSNEITSQTTGHSLIKDYRYNTLLHFGSYVPCSFIIIISKAFRCTHQVTPEIYLIIQLLVCLAHVDMICGLLVCFQTSALSEWNVILTNREDGKWDPRGHKLDLLFNRHLSQTLISFSQSLMCSCSCVRLPWRRDAWPRDSKR